MEPTYERRLASVVIADRSGRVLLGLREDFDVWGLPGGVVEAGETHADAAIREAREELGVDVTLGARIGSYLRNGPFGDGLSLTYAATIVAGTPTADGVETLEVGWFALDALPLMLWWNKPPLLDHAAGRVDVERRFAVPCRHGALSRAEVYALRDQSTLTRQAFFLDAFPEPELDELVPSH